MKYQNQKDKTIIKFIKKARRRISTNIFLNSLLIYLSAGFLVGTLINIIAIFIPIYQAFIIAAVIVSFGAFIGIIFSVLKFPSRKKAALLTDKTGLEERLITSYELCGKNTAFSELQKENTVKQLEHFIWKEKLPLKVNTTYLIIFLIFSFSFGVSAIIPSQAKEDAIGNYKIKKMTKEEIKKVEKVKKELEKIDTFSKEEKEKIKNLFDKTIEELREVKEEKEITKAKERLKTKLEKQLEKQNNLEKSKQIEDLAKSLELPNLLNSKKQEEKKKKQKELLAQKQELEKLKNIKKKLKKEGKLTEKEINDLKKLAASLSEEQLNKLLEQLKEKLGSFELNEEELKKLKDALENAENFVSNSIKELENQEDITDSNISLEKINQSLSGDTTQQAQGKSSNAKNKNGAGKQNAQGKGLNGEGMGQGWNYGSKKGIEKESQLSQNPEQVIIPDKEQEQDKNLTGKVSKNGNSYTTSSENGLTWAGEKVDYHQVVSDYTEEAYSKIENNKVPEEMKEIIKSYFEKLNQ